MLFQVSVTRREKDNGENEISNTASTASEWNGYGKGKGGVCILLEKDLNFC